MLILCQKHGIDVCLVTLPLNRLILDKLDNKTLVAFDAVIDNLARDFQVQRLNLLQKELEDDCFIDINHLNFKGGRIITKMLMNAME